MPRRLTAWLGWAALAVLEGCQSPNAAYPRYVILHWPGEDAFYAAHPVVGKIDTREEDAAFLHAFATMCPNWQIEDSTKAAYDAQQAEYRK